MISQTDDASPEVFQKRYDEYQIQYCKDVSKRFFERNKSEEWFRERYDPLLQQTIEKESQEWSAIESKNIFDILTNSDENTNSIQLGISLSESSDKLEVNESENIEDKSTLGL